MKSINKILTMLAILGIFAFAVYAINEPVEKTKEQTITPTIALEEQHIFISQEPVYEDGVGVKYDGYVTVVKTEALTGKKTIVEDGKHNLLVTSGKSFIVRKLSGNDVNASNITRAISLSADSGAGIAVGDTQLASELTTNGFIRNNSAQYLADSTYGYFVNATWTATGSQWINSTGLNYNNQTNSNGNLFAELAITPQSMLVNDQLSVSWNISVS